MGREVPEDPLSAPVHLEARLDELQGIQAEGLGVAPRVALGIDDERAVRPAEALEQPDAHLVLQRDEELLRGQQAQFEQGRALLAAAALHEGGGAVEGGPVQAARVHELDAQALARQVRLGEDGPALLEQEAFSDAVA